jgi:hypothetical protein
MARSETSTLNELAEFGAARVRQRKGGELGFFARSDVKGSKDRCDDARENCGARIFLSSVMSSACETHHGFCSHELCVCSVRFHLAFVALADRPGEDPHSVMARTADGRSSPFASATRPARFVTGSPPTHTIWSQPERPGQSVSALSLVQ